MLASNHAPRDASPGRKPYITHSPGVSPQRPDKGSVATSGAGKAGSRRQRSNQSRDVSPGGNGASVGEVQLDPRQQQ